MKYLVIGGAGFLGSTLVDRLLAEGQAVDVIDDLSTGSLANLAEARADRSHDFTFHRLDAAEAVTADLLARRRPDVLFHLALPLRPTDQTVTAFQQLLAGARVAGVSKVVVGLDARLLYGPIDPADLPVREAHPGRNHTPEGLATRGVIDALSSARASDDLEFTALALGTIYGPRQPRGSVVGRILRHAVARPATADAPVVPPDDATDLVFVDDAVDALDRAASRGHGLVVNVGTGVATGLADLRAVAADVADRLVPDPEARPGLTPDPAAGSAGLTHFSLDAARAGMQLGWEPWTSVEDGVAVTLAWELEQMSGG